jgi:hypothetical protein
LPANFLATEEQMNKLVVGLAAVTVLAACSDTSGPVSNSDLRVAYGKVKTPPPIPVSGNLQNVTYSFGAGGAEGAAVTTGSTTLTVEDQTGVTAASIPTDHPPAFTAGNYVLGRLNNEAVNLSVSTGATKFSVAFDLWLIGSWDGRGQQAQHGAFGEDSWEVGAVCGSSIVPIFVTSFSNQKTVQQAYPGQVTDGGGAKYASGSVGHNETGYTDANVPLFNAYVDVHYQLSFSGLNPCPGGTAWTAIKMLIPDFDLQTRTDESWAIDNLTLKTDS